jgi:hypothetical protein
VSASEVAPGRPGLVAWALAGAAVLAQLAGLVLAGLNAQAGRLDVGRLGICIGLTAAVGLYAGVGRLIATRKPGNAIGWLLCLVGLSSALSVMTEQYALFGIATVPGNVPASRLAGWLPGPLGMITILLVALLVLLFPDGQLPSRRWRPVLWAAGVVAAIWMAAQLQASITMAGAYTGALAAAGVDYPNPLGIFPRHGWFSTLIAVNYGLALVLAVLVVASVFARRRGASVERRKQLAWLGYVGLLTAIWAVGLTLVSWLLPGQKWAGQLMWDLMVLTPAAGIPLACAVAVLKYRLYDIDRLISRTVSYAIVTGLLVGVYAGLVLLTTATGLLREPVAVAGSTLAVAAVFSPLRRRVQTVVDRRFNRTRYDADLMIAAFAARLQDATDLDAVRADLAATVDRALEPDHLSVWTGRSPRSGRLR